MPNPKFVQPSSRYAIPSMMERGATGFSGDRMLSAVGTCAKLGISRTTLYDWCNRGLLPRQIKLGPRRVGWRESAIDEYLSQREAA
jgi:prophage regulatory protein